MLAKNALALRRVTPVGHRCMSALAGNVDKMAANAAQMEKALPEMLKPLAADMPGFAADLKAKVAANPELYKTIEAKIAEADKPGVRATVDAPKAPHSCKYTQEGSVAYYVVGHIARADRRMKMLADVDVTPTAAQKAEWEADAEEWSKDTIKAAMASQGITADQMKEAGM